MSGLSSVSHDATVFNRVTDDYGTVGGGAENRAGNDAGTTDDAGHNAVGGGLHNTASGFISTVGGGDMNTAGGDRATVPGGALNSASGSYSFAAGNNAQAVHSGTFVWASSTEVDSTPLASTGVNQFLINAEGGVGINTNSPQSALQVNGYVQLALTSGVPPAADCDAAPSTVG